MEIHLEKKSNFLFPAALLFKCTGNFELVGATEKFPRPSNTVDGVFCKSCELFSQKHSAADISQWPRYAFDLLCWSFACDKVFCTMLPWSRLSHFSPISLSYPP